MNPVSPCATGISTTSKYVQEIAVKTFEFEFPLIQITFDDLAQKAVAGAISFPPLNAIKNAEIEIWQKDVVYMHVYSMLVVAVAAMAPPDPGQGLSAVSNEIVNCN